MKFGKKSAAFAFFLIASFLFTNFYHPVFSQEKSSVTFADASIPPDKEVLLATNHETTDDKPFLVFGFSADSPPVSKGGENISDKIDGNTFCGELYTRINSAFSSEYNVVQVPMFSGQRFSGFTSLDIPTYGKLENEAVAERFLTKEKNIGLECGPNSIRGFRIDKMKPYNGSFSEQFYETSAKVLIHKDNRNLLYRDDFPLAPEGNQSNQAARSIIAVVGGTEEFEILDCPTLLDPTLDPRSGGTTTVDAINTIYGATVKEYAVRDQAVRCLTNSNSSTLAYASDHILLQGLLKQFSGNFSLEDFVIEPRTHNLTYERYGIVIYEPEENEGKLKNTVNAWISENGITLMQKMESELSTFEYTVEGDLTRKFWRPLVNMYREKIPVHLASNGALPTAALIIISGFLIALFLTHRLIVLFISKLFPQVFQLVINTRRFLREKGDETNNPLFQWLGNIKIIPEELFAQVIKENRRYYAGSTAETDEYDIFGLLESQTRIFRDIDRIAKQERIDTEEAKEQLVKNIAKQMKHHPQKHNIVREWINIGGAKFMDNFGGTFGQELATKFLEISVGWGKKDL